MVSFNEMKQYQKIALGGAVLAIISIFLPVFSASGPTPLGVVSVSVSGYQALGANWFTLGLIIAILAIVNELFNVNNKSIRMAGYLGLGVLSILAAIVDLVQGSAYSANVAAVSGGAASVGFDIGAYLMVLALLLFIVSGWQSRKL